MNKILAYGQIYDAIRNIRSLKIGFLTNFYYDQKRCDFLIKNELLYFVMVGNTYYIYHKDKCFFHLYFLTTTLDELYNSLCVLLKGLEKKVTIDIIGNPENIRDIKQLFENVGFNKYCRLKRMTRISRDEANSSIKEIVYGTQKDGEVVYDFLQIFFDPLSEQLPMMAEIEEWVDNNHLLVYKVQGRIAGFVLFDLIGLTSYLRYWFVHPDFRDQGVGSCLLRQYFYESRDTKRQLFWVINTNENAIKRYKHYGFSEENLIDEILLLN